jgi:MerR family transcriptional regulator, copper efflux regulator
LHSVTHPSERQDLHQIGEVAERVGLSLRTVRYYEEVGLLIPSGRTQGGFRLYTDADVERLTLIKQMKPLGFSIEEMRELLTVCDHLAEGIADQAERRVLIERLNRFATSASDKFESLRQQVAVAEVFAETLRHEVRRHQQSTGGKQT